MKSTTRPLIWIVIALALIASIYYFINKTTAAEELLTYKNASYGVSFSYPKEWLFNVSDSNFLDIHISNTMPSEGLGCTTDFAGVELQFGHTKDPQQTFEDFVKGQHDFNSEFSHMGATSGSLEPMYINDHQAFKVGSAGAETGCSNPGYYIEQDAEHYAFIFEYIDTDEEGSPEDLTKVEAIVKSITFNNNQ